MTVDNDNGSRKFVSNGDSQV